MLALTETAVQAVRSAIRQVEDPVAGLRIMVESGGCAGYRYSMGLESEARDDDTVFEFDDIKVFVDPASRPMLEDVKVDFVESLSGSGFVFDNPNAEKKCGCGKSFC